MKFFKSTATALFVTMLLVFHSCSIKEVVKDTPTPEVATTEDDITAVVTGMYARFNDSGMFKFLGHIMLAICGDDMYSQAGSEYGPYAARTLTSTNTAPMWNGMYQCIASANSLMATLDKLNLKPGFKQNAYGEAYFVRAFCYYYLVRLYGGVPLRLSATTIESDFNLRRNSVDEVYAQIFSDLKKASTLLAPGVITADIGHATKGAAQAIMAQAYLTYGNMQSLKGQDATANYTNAVTYADSVIASGAYSLTQNYADLYDITKETAAYNEVIFGIRFQTDPTNRAQPAAGSEYSIRFGAANTWYVSGTPNSGNGDGTFRVQPWIIDFYRTGDYANSTGTIIDYRNDASFMQTGVNGNFNPVRVYYIYPNVVPAGAGNFTITEPLLAKYKDPGGKDARNNGNDFFIIRYSEIYLIKAEAMNELTGPTTANVAAFNVVRARARQANGTARTYPLDLTVATAGTKDNFRLKIFDERGLELIGEGQRWFDLVRMRSPVSATQTMYEWTINTRLANTTTYPRTLPTYINTAPRRYSNKNAVFAATFNVTFPKWLLFPVPATEIIQNKNFGQQNPGW